MCNCRFCCKGENFAYFVVNNYLLEPKDTTFE